MSQLPMPLSRWRQDSSKMQQKREHWTLDFVVTRVWTQTFDFKLTLFTALMNSLKIFSHDSLLPPPNSVIIAWRPSFFNKAATDASSSTWFWLHSLDCPDPSESKYYNKKVIAFDSDQSISLWNHSNAQQTSFTWWISNTKPLWVPSGFLMVDIPAL